MIEHLDHTQQLLEQWAELEPDRCTAVDDGFQVDDVEISRCYWIGQGYWLGDVEGLANLARLQASLQLAIAARKARCRLENSSESWHVAIGRPEPKSSNFQILVFGKNENPAIAMLEAWVNFLQAEAKFQSTQKAPSSIA